MKPFSLQCDFSTRLYKSSRFPPLLGTSSWRGQEERQDSRSRDPTRIVLQSWDSSAFVLNVLFLNTVQVTIIMSEKKIQNQWFEGIPSILEMEV